MPSSTCEYSQRPPGAYGRRWNYPSKSHEDPEGDR